MNISKKRQMELFTAIHGPIMDMRVRLELSKIPITEHGLFTLEQVIWKKVETALGLKK